jgi:hypothetical protein
MSAEECRLPVGAGRLTEQYWFPRQLIRMFILVPDPMPLPDRYTYVRTIPLDLLRLKELEASGDAVYVPGEHWLRSLEQQRNWMPATADAAGAADPSTEPDPSELSELRRSYKGEAGLHRFESVTRIWQESIGDMTLFADTMVVDQARHRKDEVVRRSITVREDSGDVKYLRGDRTVAEIVVPYFTLSNEKMSVRFSIHLALEAVRHMQAALYASRRRARRTVTTELLPPVLHYEVGTVNAACSENDDYPVNDWSSDMTGVNNSLDWLLCEPVLSRQCHVAPVVDGTVLSVLGCQAPSRSRANPRW